MTTTQTTAQENRSRLLNMAAGGDGNTAAWIERVTYDDAPADAQAYGYIVHFPQSSDGGRIIPALDVQVRSEDAARGLLQATRTGAKPRNPEDSAAAIAAEADGIAITDTGRHVPYTGRHIPADK